MIAAVASIIYRDYIVPRIAAAAGTLAAVLRTTVVQLAMSLVRIPPAVFVAVIVQTRDVRFPLPKQAGGSIENAGVIPGTNQVEAAFIRLRIALAILIAGRPKQRNRYHADRGFPVFSHGRLAY